MLSLLKVWLHCVWHSFEIHDHQWWMYEELTNGKLKRRVHFCRCGYNNDDELDRETLINLIATEK